MSTCIERIEKLRHILGISQAALLHKIGKRAPSAYTNWVTGKSAPDRDTLFAIADRWFVDYDSLWGRPGTDGLEPSPELRRAQELLLHHVTQEDYSAQSPTERIVVAFRFMSERMPTFTVGGWSDWLHWTENDWYATVGGYASVGDVQKRQASLLLGWFQHRDAWYQWIETGHSDLLAPLASEQLRELIQRLTRAGLDYPELRRIYDHLNRK